MNITTRKHAFMVHLAISIFIFLLLLAIIRLLWFPGVYVGLGGWQGLKIIAGVDLVLGPLLTFLVFKPNKKGLKGDLFCIAGLQSVCLAVGVWLTYQERPVLQVFTDKQIYIFTQSDLQYRDIPASIPQSLSGAYPKQVYLDLPDDNTMIKTIKFTNEYVDLQPIAARHDLYRIMSIKSEAALKWRLEQLKYDAEMHCWEVEVLSKHFSGYTCFNLEDGLLVLY